MTSKREVRLKVVAGGLQVVYSDDLVGLLAKGQTQTVRASHVEPATSIGWEADGWVADMRPIGGPILVEHVDATRHDLKVPFTTRQAALSAELAYLREHLGL